MLKGVIYGTVKRFSYALFTVDKVNYCRLGKKKKKRRKRGEENVDVQTKRSHSLKRELFGYMIKKLRLNSHFPVIVNHFSILWNWMCTRLNDHHIATRNVWSKYSLSKKKKKKTLEDVWSLKMCYYMCDWFTLKWWSWTWI